MDEVVRKRRKRNYIAGDFNDIFKRCIHLRMLSLFWSSEFILKSNTYLLRMAEHKPILLLFISLFLLECISSDDAFRVQFQQEELLHEMDPLHRM